MSESARKREYTYRRARGKPLTLVPGPSLAGHVVQWDEQSRVLYIDQILIPCTVTEFRLLKLLLERNEQRVSYQQLLVHIEERWEDPALARLARNRLPRLICGIRTKIWPCSLDVVCLVGYGYMLVNCNPPPDQARR